MKLTRLYSNLSYYFSPVEFNDGLNVVIAEIRHPENRAKSSHNLGKSTLARVMDFCLLGKVDKNHFFKKREDLFCEFDFYLEMELLDGKYLTICRSVAAPSKISFRLSEFEEFDLTSVPKVEWTHRDLPLEKAQDLLDGYLDFQDISPWKYREVLGYFLRRQSDYDDVFKLQRHMGPDIYWKPVLAQVLGLDANIFRARYENKRAIESKEVELVAFETQVGASDVQLENADALLQLRQEEANQRQAELDSFDFQGADTAATDRLVSKIDKKIASYNQQRYTLTYNVRQIEEALQEDKITFNPDKAKALFEETGVLFPEQIKKDFDQLISFNRAITHERRHYLKEELEETRAALSDIKDALDGLNAERKSALAFLRSEDVFKKYKEISSQVSKLNSEITILRKQQDYMTNIQDKREELRKLKADYSTQQGVAERHVSTISRNPQSILAETRKYFSAIIDRVLGRKALLNVLVNSEGNLDFRAEFVDEKELSTSEGDGTSYRKLMCVAFDLAVLRAHLPGKFPRFVYHDGIFETLDPRPKQNLLEVIREYSELGIQIIITLIDADAPTERGARSSAFNREDIVVTLHDDGKEGRLFKFDSW